MKKSQTAIEAALIITFMLLVLSIFLGIMLYRSQEIKKESETQALAAIDKIIQKEISMAQKAEDGYSRYFQIPAKVGEIPFNLSLINATKLNPASPTDYAMLVIDASSYRKNLEYVDAAIPKNVFGMLCNNATHKNRIRKVNKNIIISCAHI